MKKIAIKGHVTRGNDVIKILESLSGNNIQGYQGNTSSMYYYVNDKNYIDCDTWICLDKKYKTYTLEKYEQEFNIMEKRNIQINLTTAKEWYNQGGDLKKIALQAFSENELQSLPKSWEEYCKINPYLVRDKEVIFRASGNMSDISYIDLRREEYPGAIPSEKRAQQFLTLNKLLQIRDYYNQGWEPDWTDGIDKYTIWTFRNKLLAETTTYVNGIFTFKSKELRDEFLTNFKPDLEFIKGFL